MQRGLSLDTREEVNFSVRSSFLCGKLYGISRRRVYGGPNAQFCAGIFKRRHQAVFYRQPRQSRFFTPRVFVECEEADAPAVFGSKCILCERRRTQTHSAALRHSWKRRPLNFTWSTDSVQRNAVASHRSQGTETANADPHTDV